MLRATTIFPLLLLIVLTTACGDGDNAGGENIRGFTAGMQWNNGFVPFYVDPKEGKVFLLLTPTNRDLLYQPSLPRGVGSNDIGLDRGQQISDGAYLVRFDPVGDRVLMNRLNTRHRSESDNAAERLAATEAFASSVLWGFPVVARDGEQMLVDATEFLLRDSHGVARRLKSGEQGDFQVDASRSAPYLPRSKAFPRNTELEAIVSFRGEKPGAYLKQVAPDPYAVTVHMHHSFIALPEAGYEPRSFHPESGFFDESWMDYAAPIDSPLERRVISRHRLAKKDPAAPLSRAVEPIVYYLDPGTPEPVRSAILDGAGWWADAFVAAGLEDAFRVEMLPDSADPMDVRYNVIQWVHRATRGWSYGLRVVDPRSGEIIKGHVTLGSLRVRQDILIARGMTSPFAADGPGDVLTTDMVLARIRQLAAHEVGHTLGLAHNFVASTQGRTSVMDYPYPQLTLSEDGNIMLDNAYAAGIGEWDKRAIRYGYSTYGDQESEAAALTALLADNRDEGFLFISDPDSRSAADFHARSHLWDNGADPVAELHRILALRDAALSRFGANSIPPGTAFSELEKVLVPVFLYHRYQVEAVGKLLGGADYRYALRGELDAGEMPLRYVPPARQAAALDALMSTLEVGALTVSPDLLQMIPPPAYGHERTRESAPSSTGRLFDPAALAAAAAGHTLDSLLHRERLARIALQHSANAQQLSLDQLFRRLHGAVLLPEYKGLEAAVDRRRVSALLSRWRALLLDAQAAPDVRAASLSALLRARRLLRARQRGGAEYSDLYALENQLIRQALEQSAALPDADSPALPPGSPIGASAPSR